jgi:hypothetical protein
MLHYLDFIAHRYISLALSTWKRRCVGEKFWKMAEWQAGRVLVAFGALVVRLDHNAMERSLGHWRSVTTWETEWHTREHAKGLKLLHGMSHQMLLRRLQQAWGVWRRTSTVTFMAAEARKRSALAESEKQLAVRDAVAETEETARVAKVEAVDRVVVAYQEAIDKAAGARVEEENERRMQLQQTQQSQQLQQLQQQQNSMQQQSQTQQQQQYNSMQQPSQMQQQELHLSSLHRSPFPQQSPLPPPIGVTTNTMQPEQYQKPHMQVVVDSHGRRRTVTSRRGGMGVGGLDSSSMRVDNSSIMGQNSVQQQPTPHQQFGHQYGQQHGTPHRQYGDSPYAGGRRSSSVGWGHPQSPPPPDLYSSGASLHASMMNTNMPQGGHGGNGAPPSAQKDYAVHAVQASAQAIHASNLSHYGGGGMGSTRGPRDSPYGDTHASTMQGSGLNASGVHGGLEGYGSGIARTHYAAASPQPMHGGMGVALSAVRDVRASALRESLQEAGKQSRKKEVDAAVAELRVQLQEVSRHNVHYNPLRPNPSSYSTSPYLFPLFKHATNHKNY